MSSATLAFRRPPLPRKMCFATRLTSQSSVVRRLSLDILHAIVFATAELALESCGRLAPTLGAMRLSCRVFAQVAAAYLFQLVIIDSRSETRRRVFSLAETSLARHVRVVEYNACWYEDMEDKTDMLFLAIAVRRFPALRELNVLLAHMFPRNASIPPRVMDFPSLRCRILGQMFRNVNPPEFSCLAWITLRTDAESFVALAGNGSGTSVILNGDEQCRNISSK